MQKMPTTAISRRQLMAALDECDDAGLWTRAQPVRGGGGADQAGERERDGGGLKPRPVTPSGPTGGRCLPVDGRSRFTLTTGQGFVVT